MKKQVEDVKEVKGKVVDMKGQVIEEAVAEEGVTEGPLEEMVKEESAPKEEMIQLSLNDVNNFMSIVDAVLIEDVRANVVLKHFTKMLVKHNPQLSIQQAPPQPQAQQ